MKRMIWLVLVMGLQPFSQLIAGEKVKNLIMIIGDGMGPQQLGLLELFAQKAKESPYKKRQSHLSSWAASAEMALSLHGPRDGLVVDSACSATQLASGQASNSEMIGLNADGYEIQSILSLAKAAGKGVGVVTDTRLTHATPAAFYAHVPHRDMENQIAQQLVQAAPDVALGGGLRYFLPQDKKLRDAMAKEFGNQLPPRLEWSSRRQDDANPLKAAQSQGYEISFDRRQLLAAKGPRLLGLFASSALPDAITYHNQEKRQIPEVPSLADMASKAIDILAQRPQGFFLMIEAGQIDWAGHNNDAGQLLHEMLRFDEMIAAVRSWAEGRSDTLVVVTADHETGGFGFSYSRYHLPKAQTLKAPLFKGRAFQPQFNFGQPEILDGLYAQKKSYWNIFTAFDALPSKRRQPKELMDLINANSEFKIDLAGAKAVLAEETHRYYTPGHAKLGVLSFAKIHDFDAFYVDPDGGRPALLARQLAAASNVVWATGTHTTTPVAVFAWGPGQHTRRFKGILHHTKVGQLAIESLIKGW